MGGYPIQALLFPIVGVLVVAFMMIRQRSQITRHEEQNARFRAGNLAQSMGLQLVEGDPNFNLFIRQANVDVHRGPSDKKAVQVRVLARGAPQGVPLELSYIYRVEMETGFVEVRWTTWFDCRVTAHTRQAFPPFEVMSRQAPLGPIAQTQALPPQPTGNPQVDATYLVCTSDAGLARFLGELLPGFATFHNSGIHLVGDGQSVAFVMKQDKAPLLANALYYAQEMAAQLTHVARKLGG